MAYSQCIIKEGKTLVKYIPEGERGEPPKAVMLPEDIEVVGAACLAPEGTAIPDDVAFEWDINFPVQVVIIPETVKEVKPASFMGLMTLKSFMVAEDCPAVTLENGVLYSRDLETVLCCPPCMEGDITLSAKTKVIEENAFEGCYLSSVVIPEGTEEIKEDNFSYSYDLEKVVVPASVRKIGERCFEENDNLTVFVSAGSVAEQYCKRHKIAYEVM